MHIWLLVIGSLFLQESISTSLALLTAYRAGYSPILITVAWFFIALIEISAGFYFGKFLKKRFAGSKFETWVLKQVSNVTQVIGAENERLLLIALTILTFPTIAGLIAAWIDISLVSTLVYCMIGDLLWYAWVWVRVFGADEFAASFKEAAIGFFILGIVLSVGFRIVMKQKKNIRSEH
jgi:hypothetical protein